MRLRDRAHWTHRNGEQHAHHDRAIHLAQDDDRLRGHILSFEVRIQRVHLHEDILMQGKPDHVDPDKWRPLIMSFQKFYGLSAQQVHGSRLSVIPEKVYRSPDVDRAREAALCA